MRLRLSYICSGSPPERSQRPQAFTNTVSPENRPPSAPSTCQHVEPGVCPGVCSARMRIGPISTASPPRRGVTSPCNSAGSLGTSAVCAWTRTPRAARSAGSPLTWSKWWWLTSACVTARPSSSAARSAALTSQAASTMAVSRAPSAPTRYTKLSIGPSFSWRTYMHAFTSTRRAAPQPRKPAAGRENAYLHGVDPVALLRARLREGRRLRELTPESKLPFVDNCALVLGARWRINARTAFQGARNAPGKARIEIGDDAYVGSRVVLRAGLGIRVGRHVTIAANVVLSSDPGHPLDPAARRTEAAPLEALSQMVVGDDVWIAEG